MTHSSAFSNSGTVAASDPSMTEIQVTNFSTRYSFEVQSALVFIANEIFVGNGDQAH